MKRLKNTYFKLLINNFPILIFVLFLVTFFWKTFFLNLVPIPADLVVGAYFPWLDYKWGYDVGVPVKNLITSDVVSVIYPLKSYAIDLVLNGESALWNPLMFGGYPLLANFQIGIFSLSTLFYLFLPKVSAWSAQIIIQPFLGMVFSYIYLRHLKISKISSILGSAIFAFSGFNIIWMEWGAHGLTAAFIPLILYFVSKFVETKKIYWGVLLSIAISLQIFSGYPQLFIYTLIAVIFNVVICYKEYLSFEVVLKLTLFIFMGVAGSSIQLLPAIELLKNSQRVAENLSYDLTYLPWQNWISFLAPDFFGNHSTGNFWGIGNYTNNVGYSSIVGLCLAFVSILTLSDKNETNNKIIRYFLLLLIVSLLLSFPFPWTKYLYSLHLPGIGASSLTRILILTNLAIAYLSALGLDILLKSKTKKLTIITLCILCILSILFIYSYLHYKNGNLLYLISIRNLILPIILSFLVFILSFFFFKFRKYVKLSASLIIVVSVFEVFRFGWKYTPFTNAKLIFPDTPITNFLKQNKLSRVYFDDVIPMNMWVNYGLSSLSGYDAVYPQTISKFIAVINSNNPKASLLDRQASINNINSKLFDLTNNKYLLALKKDEKGKPSIDGHILSKYETIKFKQVYDDKSVVVLENKNAFPNIFFVSDWEVVKDDEKVMERLLDAEFDLSKKIILSSNFDKFIQSDILPKYEISNLVYKPGSISLDLTNDLNGFLFISDTYYPGWECYIDGQRTDIYRADYTYRAVSVEKSVENNTHGNIHKIVFIYDPKSFRIGKFVSVSTLLILILLILYGYKKDR